MKPQSSWADTDTEPAVANSAAAAITIAGCFIAMEAYPLLIVEYCSANIWGLSIQFVDLICNYLFLHARQTARPRSIIRQSLWALGDRSLRCCRSAWQVEGFLHLARHRLKRRSQEQHCYYFRQDSAVEDCHASAANRSEDRHCRRRDRPAKSAASRCRPEVTTVRISLPSPTFPTTSASCDATRTRNPIAV